MIDLILDSALDTIKLIPFLFFTYLFLEYIEHKTNERVEAAIEKSGKLGPVIGGALGIIPQCGFSSVAANFYAGKIITMGTLIAIFISTSDEMLPIFIASAAPASTIAKILGFKLLIAVIAGFAIDAVFKHPVSHEHEDDIHHLCENDNCNCGQGNIFYSAAKHTLNISVFIFVITFICGILINVMGEDSLGQVFTGIPVIGEMISAIIGVIPNCASSVLIANLYLDGIMPAGPLISGLAMNSGVGLLVLFKMNRNLKENLKMTGLLYAIAVISGTLVSLLNISF